MKVLLTGATGAIGRALVLKLRGKGHCVSAWVRDLAQARNLLGREADLVPSTLDDRGLAELLQTCHAVIHLAGAPVIGRWTAARRHAIEESRIGLAKRLVAAIGRASPRPAVFVSASGVGYYGDRGDDVLTEESPLGSDYLAEVCRDWEAAATEAEAHGVRVVRLRIGIVLGRDGGAIAKLLPVFRLGLGGPLGSGRQFMPWVHERDVVEVAARALTDDRFSGAYNVTAPEPVTSRGFAKTFGRVLHRPAFLSVPGAPLRIPYGQAASAVLSSQRALPRALERLGYPFFFPELGPALSNLAFNPQVRVERWREPAGEGYLAERPPTHLLRSGVTLGAPPTEVTRFFSDPSALAALTPRTMRLDLGEGEIPAQLTIGAELRQTFRLGPFPLPWRGRVEALDEGQMVDSLTSGPFASWWHEHRFTPFEGGTRIDDRLFFALPFGLLGRLVAQWAVERSLREVFGYRNEALRFRFGSLHGGGSLH